MTSVIEIGGEKIAQEPIEARWVVKEKPDSLKAQRHINDAMEADGVWVPRRAHVSQRPVRFGRGGPIRLELPGLTVGWAKVTAVLDGLAKNFEGDTLTLTVDQFRNCIR